MKSFLYKAAEIAAITVLLTLAGMVLIKFTFAAVTFFMPTAWLATQVFVTILLHMWALASLSSRG